MILKAFFLLFDTDFDDSFGGDAEPDPDALYIDWHLHILVPFVLAVIIVLGCWWIAWAWGVRNARKRVLDARKRAAQDIYNVVRKRLDAALVAQGGTQIDRVRELRDVLQSRLSQVMALSVKPGKSLEALEKALTSDEGRISVSTSVAGKERVAMGSEEHRMVVWQALHKFKTFWDNEAGIVALIVACQDELAREDGLKYIEFLDRQAFEEQKAAGVAATVKLAQVKDAVPVAAPAPAPVAPPQPKTEAPDEPPPPPPAPPKPTKGKLPAHKRNMLA